MQDRYAADIGDFGKFQLLRYMFNNTEYNLKQIWYMYPDEFHNNDGQYINYFEKVKGVDPFLEETLCRIIKTNRSVYSLEKAQLLNNCEYFSSCVNENGKDDLIYRKSWFKKACMFAYGADFILVDPDNGIATKLIKEKDSKNIKLLTYDDFQMRSKAGKYIFFDEIESLYSLGFSIIIYHHLNRTMSHDKQIKILKDRLKENFLKVIAIKHKPYSPRVYFFIFSQQEVFDFCLKYLKTFEKSFSDQWKLFL